VCEVLAPVMKILFRVCVLFACIAMALDLRSDQFFVNFEPNLIILVAKDYWNE